MLLHPLSAHQPHPPAISPESTSYPPHLLLPKPISSPCPSTSSSKATHSPVSLLSLLWVQPDRADRTEDPKQWSDLKLATFQPKTFADDDVEIAITHCGVCGSDVHTLTQGWGASKLPLVVGHEIIGKITRVGKKVAGMKVSFVAMGVGAY